MPGGIWSDSKKNNFFFGKFTWMNDHVRSPHCFAHCGKVRFLDPYLVQTLNSIRNRDDCLFLVLNIKTNLSFPRNEQKTLSAFTTHIVYTIHLPPHRSEIEILWTDCCHLTMRTCSTDYWCHADARNVSSLVHGDCDYPIVGNRRLCSPCPAFSVCETTEA